MRDQPAGPVRTTALVTRESALEVERGPALTSASILKPLYAWAAGASADDVRVRASVEWSSNDDTTAVVEEGGGLAAVLARLEDLSGVHLEPAPTWGAVLVTATQVAQAYAALSADEEAAGIVALMRRSRRGQRFGCDEAWGRLTGEDPSTLAVKTGWYLREDGVLRTHVVVLGGRGGGVVLTGVPLGEAERSDWEGRHAALGPEGVLPLHEEHARRLLHAGLALAAKTLDAAPGEEAAGSAR